MLLDHALTRDIAVAPVSWRPPMAAPVSLELVVVRDHLRAAPSAAASSAGGLGRVSCTGGVRRSGYVDDIEQVEQEDHL
jgi:hypothetical protein